MHSIVSSLFLVGVASLPLMAGTVVITSVADPEHELEPLISFGGLPLAEGTQVLVGAFPGLSDEQVLDLASQRPAIVTVVARVEADQVETVEGEQA